MGTSAVAHHSRCLRKEHWGGQLSVKRTGVGIISGGRTWVKIRERGNGSIKKGVASMSLSFTVDEAQRQGKSKALE